MASSSLQQRQQTPPQLDRTTRTALLLTLVTLLGLCSLSLWLSPSTVVVTTNASTRSYILEPQHDGRFLDEDNDNNNNNDDDQSNNDDYSSQSCNFIYEKTSTTQQQCAFAKTCNGNSGIWASWVFCSKHTRLWCILLSPIMLLWMVLLFRLLGSTAEDYFSPSLEMFSVKLGLPPRFAGVSLLALGNGAADVSATVSAFKNDPDQGYKLSLGALSGAAMLISGVISAIVILTAQGVPCRGALVRDVTALLITIVTVWSTLATGSVSPNSVSLFFSLYVVYVLIVLLADVYHRAVVVPRLTALQHNQEQSRQLEAADVLDSTRPNGGSSEENNNRISHMLTALSNYDNDTAEAWGGVESEDLQHNHIQLHGHGGVLDKKAAAPTNAADDPQSPYRLVQDDDLPDTNLCVGSTGGVPATSWRDAFQQGMAEIRHHANETWDDIVYDGDLHWMTKFLLLCELPFTVLRKATVPIPCEKYYCRGVVVASLLLSPLWLGYYLWESHGVQWFGSSHGWWLYWLILQGIMVVAGLALLRLAPAGGGDLSLLVATPIALYGFVIAATWIDTIADSLVSLLNFVGIILRIPGAVIGLTILAWGNSAADLSANMTMARKGLANMAMTACFAGPVFNILVGLGMGFSSLAAITGNATNEVTLSPSVLTGFVFIILNAVALLGTGLGLGKGKIPKQYGYGALALYCIYVVVGVTLQYSKHGSQ